MLITVGHILKAGKIYETISIVATFPRPVLGTHKSASNVIH